MYTCTSAPYSVESLQYKSCHRGRATTQEIWVFGIVDTSHQPALGYMEVVMPQPCSQLFKPMQHQGALFILTSGHHIGVCSSWVMFQHIIR